MKYFIENLHINKLTYPKKLKFFLSEFDTLLMYINLHTKIHIFLKNRYILQKDNHFQ